MIRKKRQRKTQKDNRARWVEYERQKNNLARQHLDPAEYETAVRSLAARMGL